MNDAAEPAPAPTPAPDDATSNRLRRAVSRVALVMVFAVVLYFGFAVFSGVRALGDRLAGYAWWTFAAALLLAFSNYVIRFGKWQYYLALLDIRGIPTGDSFLTFLSGFILSVTPGKLGEVFKSYVLYETHGIPAQRTAPIVIADRLTDLIGVIVLIVIGSTRFRGGLLWAGLGSILVGTIFVFIVSRRLSMWMIALVEGFGGPGKWIAPKLREAYDSLQALTRPSRLVLPTILSIVAWFLECLALWIILRGFGQSVGALGASFFYATSTLAGIFSPGGLFLTEAVMRTLMREVGDVDPSGATGAMLLVRFATLWFAVLVGFAALTILRRKYPTLLKS